MLESENSIICVHLSWQILKNRQGFQKLCQFYKKKDANLAHLTAPNMSFIRNGEWILQLGSY